MENTQSIPCSNPIYTLNPNIERNQLSDAINACLCKAEALTQLIASITELEIYSPDTLGNYLWTLNDIVCEARWLYEKSIYKG